jgi:ribonuclease R
VADYGFFAQAGTLPVEGLVHISTLTDDYYYYDEATHTLSGRRTRRRYRLGDKVHVEVVRVDLQRRQLDFRVARRRKSEPPTSSRRSSQDGGEKPRRSPG